MIRDNLYLRKYFHYHSRKKYQRFDWQREASYIRYFIFYM